MTTFISITLYNRIPNKLLHTSHYKSKFMQAHMHIHSYNSCILPMYFC